MKPDCDVIIIGGGMAGLSAAIWAGRLGLSCMLLEKSELPGGQLHWIQDVIPDYPGLEQRGSDFAKTLGDQVRKHAEISTKTEVKRILHWQDDSLPDIHGVETGAGRLHAKAILLATGLRRRSIPAARAFSGAGVFYTSKPREQFTGKTLVIVGGGDGAVENAVLLANQWKNIYMIHRGASLRARPALVEKMPSNVTVLLDSEVVSIAGKDRIQSVLLQSGSEQKELPCDALLVKAGFEAENTLLSSGSHRFAYPGSFLEANDEQIALHSTGDMPLDSRPIWVAGDVCTGRDPSLAVASGQACIAMRSIERWLRRHA